MMLNTGEFDRLVGFARDQPPEARLVSITAIAARHNWPGSTLSPLRTPRASISKSAVLPSNFAKQSLSCAISALRSPDMSTPPRTSPGPGWWLASDGQWYPQRWETTFVYYTNESLEAVIDEASRLTKEYGEQGWEIVGSAVQRAQVTHGFAATTKVGSCISNGASSAP